MARRSIDLDQWRRLSVYQQRYDLDDRLEPLHALEKSLQRRKMRAAALARRLEQLEQMVTEARDEMAAIDSEIEGSRKIGALLIEEVLDQIQSEMGEAWSPTPVHGYRVWRIEKNRIMGNQVHWAAPELESRCLREIPGDDLPHSVDRCGPPACGIYAVKELSKFPSDVARGAIHNSVVGLVAMYGKVVEHVEGYRSAKAMAIAVSANDGRRHLMTKDQKTIAALFADPATAMAEVDHRLSGEENPTRDFLESVKTKEEQWT